MFIRFEQRLCICIMSIMWLPYFHGFEGEILTVNLLYFEGFHYVLKLFYGPVIRFIINLKVQLGTITNSKNSKNGTKNQSSSWGQIILPVHLISLLAQFSFLFLFDKVKVHKMRFVVLDTSETLKRQTTYVSVTLSN